MVAWANDNALFKPQYSSSSSREEEEEDGGISKEDCKGEEEDKDDADVEEAYCDQILKIVQGHCHRRRCSCCT